MNKVCEHVLFKHFIIFINFPWKHARSQKKFGPDQFSRLLDTNRQTSKVYIAIMGNTAYYLSFLIQYMF